MTREERTLRLEAKIIEGKSKGWTNAEIAERLGVTTTTIRNHLEAVAKAMGTTRQKLLDQPHGPHVYLKKPGPKPGKKNSKKEEETKMAKQKNNQPKLTAKQKQNKKNTIVKAPAKSKKAEQPPRILPGDKIKYLWLDDVERAIKNGTPPEELLEKYGCSGPEGEQIFKRRICSLCKRLSYADEILKWLEHSAEKNHGRSKGAKEKLKKGEEALTAIETGKEVKVGELMPEVLDSTSVEPVEVAEPLSEIDMLKAQETEIYRQMDKVSWRARGLKKRIEEQQEKISVINASVAGLEKEIHSLEEELTLRRDQVSSLNSEKEQYLSDVDSIQKEFDDEANALRKLNAEATEIREQIAIAETVVIEVRKDRTIGPENPEENIVLDESGHDELADKLYKDEICGDLSARDIRILARALCVARNTERRLSFVFDNGAIEVAFQQLFSN